MFKKVIFMIILLTLSVFIYSDEFTGSSVVDPGSEENAPYQLEVNKNFYEMTLGVSVNLGAPGDFTLTVPSSNVSLGQDGEGPSFTIPITSAFMTYFGTGVPFSLVFYGHTGNIGIGFQAKTSYNCGVGLGLTNLVIMPIPIVIYMTHDIASDIRFLMKFGQRSYGRRSIFEAGIAVTTKFVNPIMIMGFPYPYVCSSVYAGPSFLIGNERIVDNFAVSVGFVFEALMGYSRDVFSFINSTVMSSWYFNFAMAEAQNPALLAEYERQFDLLFPEQFSAVLKFGIEIRWSYVWSNNG